MGNFAFLMQYFFSILALSLNLNMYNIFKEEIFHRRICERKLVVQPGVE